jgi:isoquinoline 1-oxidoreductase beta subunit
MPGVKNVVRVGDSAVAVVADTWWQAKSALDAMPVVWDEGENAKVSSASIAKPGCKEGLDARTAFIGNQAAMSKQRSRPPEDGRGGLRLSLSRTTPPWSR